MSEQGDDPTNLNGGINFATCTVREAIMFLLADGGEFQQVLQATLAAFEMAGRRDDFERWYDDFHRWKAAQETPTSH